MDKYQIKDLIVDNNLEMVIKFLKSELKEELIIFSLINASIYNKSTILIYILENLNVRPDSHLGDGVTALHMANSIETMELLLNFGANINFKDNNGSTPLIYSIQSEDFECAKYLIEKGADVSIKNKDSRSAIIVASYKGIKTNNILKLFIENSLDLNMVDSEGRTALWNSTDLKNYEGMKLLLDAGADVNISDNSNETPIMLAVDAKDTKAVEILLQFPVDLSLRDCFGKTAVDLAKYCGIKKIINMLEKHQMK